MKTPLVITCEDYHDFDDYVSNFEYNGMKMDYYQVGYGKLKGSFFGGYVAVFWTKDKKTLEVKKLIRDLENELEE